MPRVGFDLFGNDDGEGLQERLGICDATFCPHDPGPSEAQEAEMVEDPDEDVRVFEGREAQSFQRDVFEQGSFFLKVGCLSYNGRLAYTPRCLGNVQSQVILQMISGRRFLPSRFPPGKWLESECGRSWTSFQAANLCQARPGTV